SITPGPTKQSGPPRVRIPAGTGTASRGPSAAIRPARSTSTTPSYGSAAPPAQTVPDSARPGPRPPTQLSRVEGRAAADPARRTPLTTTPATRAAADRQRAAKTVGSG